VVEVDVVALGGEEEGDPTPRVAHRRLYKRICLTTAVVDSVADAGEGGDVAEDVVAHANSVGTNKAHANSVGTNKITTLTLQQKTMFLGVARLVAVAGVAAVAGFWFRNNLRIT